MKKIIPSIITLIRLILIPFIIFHILHRNINLALVLFLVAVISDKLDGYLARSLNQESYYGSMFDALTDSLLIFLTIATLYIEKYFSTILLIVLITPKLITFLLLSVFHKAAYKSTIFSKGTSLLLYIIVPLFLLKAQEIVIYLLIFILYVLSAVHWVHLIKISKSFKFNQS